MPDKDRGKREAANKCKGNPQEVAQEARGAAKAVTAEAVPSPKPICKPDLVLRQLLHRAEQVGRLRQNDVFQHWLVRNERIFRRNAPHRRIQVLK